MITNSQKIIDAGQAVQEAEKLIKFAEACDRGARFPAEERQTNGYSLFLTIQAFGDFGPGRMPIAAPNGIEDRLLKVLGDFFEAEAGRLMTFADISAAAGFAPISEPEIGASQLEA